MFFELTVKITADAWIDKAYEFTQGKYKIRVDGEASNLVGGKKLVNKISVRVKAPNYKDCLPQTEGTPGNNFSITIVENQYETEIIDLLQHLESVGCFWLNIKKIHWEYWEENLNGWIAENEEEEEYLQTFNDYSWKEEAPRSFVEFKADLVGQLITGWKYADHLTLPLSFYRKGCNEMGDFQFVEAINNFYFLLEGLYGGGKYKNFEVGNEFKKSAQLRNAIDEAIKRFQTPDYLRFLQLLTKFTTAFEPQVQRHPKKTHMTFGLTIDEMIDLIVEVRGTIHHLNQNNQQASGHSFRQHEFRGVASFLHVTCLMLFVGLVGELDKSKPKFSSITISYPTRGTVKVIVPHDPQNISVFLHKIETNNLGELEYKETPYKNVTFNLSPNILLDINNELIAVSSMAVSPKINKNNLFALYPDPVTCEQCNQPCKLCISTIFHSDRDKDALFAIRIDGYLDCKNCDTDKKHTARTFKTIINESGEAIACEYQKNNCLKWSSEFVEGYKFACSQCFIEVNNESKQLSNTQTV